MPGRRPPGDHRRDRAGVDLDLGVEARRPRRSAARASARPRPRSRRGRRAGRAMYSKVVSSGATMPARPPPSIVMLQIVIRFSIESASDRLARVLDRVALHAADAEPADRRQDQVLGGDAEAELAGVVDPHRLRPALHQALGGEHVLDLGGADAEGERPEGAVGRGVRVAADDRHARLGDARARGRSRGRSRGARSRASRAGCRTPRSSAPAPRPARARARRRSAAPSGCRRWGRCGRRWPGSCRGGAPCRSARRSPSKACGEVTSWTRWRSM